MFSSPNIQQIQLSRRQAIALAGAALVSPAIGRAQHDEPRQADVTAGLALIAERDLQGAGFYRRKIGEFEVLLVSDGTFPFAPPFPLFGANVGEDKVKAALDREFIKFDHTIGHVNTLLIKTARDVVLIDTGCGSAFGPNTGKLRQRLANAGVEAKDITTVVITHAHLDHIGGLMGTEGLRAFPNAQYFLHKDEQAFWTSENPDLSKSGLPREQHAPFIAAAAGVIKSLEGRVTLVGDSNRIVEGVEAVPSPGHTPGHLAILVASGFDQLLYITDAVHHYALTMAHPDWYVAFDTDRDAAIKARRKLLDRAAADKVLISGAHLPFPGFGHVRAAGEGFDWVPAVWEWSG